MSVDGVTANAPASTTTAQSATSSDTLLNEQTFMQLLVTQLQNQDPLNPTDPTEFVTQLAQLSSVEATSNVANQMQSLVASQQATQAMQMVGQQVTYTASNGSTMTGTVQAVSLTSNPPTITIANQSVPLSSVQTVL